MNNQQSTINQEQPLTILLDRHAHRYAQQFAREQATAEKSKQVYLNTLAVYSVNIYLKCLNINSSLANSDCWKSGLRAMFDVADVILPNLGKLECRWLLPGEDAVNIPLEAREERIGYLIVQLEENLNKAKFLGFISAKKVKFATKLLNITQLQPLESLIDTIEQLQTQINLRQWLSGIFTSDWQPVETILAGRITRSLATRTPATTITRGKAIGWQLNSLEQEIILVIKVVKLKSALPCSSGLSSPAIDLCLQLYPGKANNNLAAGLAINILDQANQTYLSAQVKDRDDWMQLEFSSQQGEQFKVQMNLAGVSIMKHFIV